MLLGKNRNMQNLKIDYVTKFQQKIFEKFLAKYVFFNLFKFHFGTS